MRAPISLVKIRPFVSSISLPEKNLQPSLSLDKEMSKSYSSLAHTRTYEVDAITLLNTLQASYPSPKARQEIIPKTPSSPNDNIRACIRLLGYEVLRLLTSDLNKLNIVHVTGTKGKGSTCAYVESILNQYRLSLNVPLKIGLYTSPHLISVRERIRINSTSIARENFTRCFFQVWDCLESAPTIDGSSKPLEKIGYFRFLTLLSYHIFIQQDVNVAIYEVGVGGENDSTNIVEVPVATGISIIGIDHTAALGSTIPEIAWHKAGIMKKNCPNFTVEQEQQAMEVIQKRAIERHVESCRVVETLPQLEEVQIQPDAPFQRRNASLAVHRLSVSNPLPRQIVAGLEQVVWRGRCEKKEDELITWYLDGAHNVTSAEVAAAWFASEISRVDNEYMRMNSGSLKSGLRFLIFNQQGKRDIMALLETMFSNIRANNIQFDHVIFCPTVPSGTNARKDLVNASMDPIAIKELRDQIAFADRWIDLDPNGAKTHILASLEESLSLCRRLSSGKSEKSHVFITGSIHLVGRALEILEGVDSL
ncbi:BgTH12-01938 [Blumeria graminis f. sp. triticale]|uniref:Folylpolyglutamate synthase n=1 Tax=Blumeria graminis f. sp. triticale TaxID=1689686 RepID=A0A9W4D012_BLUGR|nr:BgTH12-01938 [Blumeria graminis f. sp. triticale]